eukprot:CAMPEP_0206049646 /NCGR_PEP_ID=MMETSP1466-20131121/27280_1 /ASSEMBLY_ACC=CAM_ASM_001126 /TAXON_ID=44452 /ORGANISM="Pavlova gyrans, Strain CCMP608" /LENGTH=432 /DNA_ID=CAMNT_0053424737 /DNA_START=42 /DNA_END=1341 /DNA_ORIENTATION=-
MKAVILIGGLDILRPLTLSLPQPLIEFCNKTLLMHQLEALKAAGVNDVVLCVHEKNLPKSWNDVITKYEMDLGLRMQCSIEKSSLGTAGPLKLAESLITNDGSSQEPFFVLNGDVLCSFPLRDMLHVHVQHKGCGTVMTTWNDEPSKYGVVVGNDKSGRIEHFVNRPETFVSNLINAGLYIFDPSIFSRLPSAGEKASMNEVLSQLATEENLYHFESKGYWVKMTDVRTFLSAVGPQLEMTRLLHGADLAPHSGAPVPPTTMIVGNVLIDQTAVIGDDCKLGPDVVIGPKCVLGNGVRLESTTVMSGVQVDAHAVIHDSVIGWNSHVGSWAWVTSSVLAEDVAVKLGTLLNGVTVLPHKELSVSVGSRGSSFDATVLTWIDSHAGFALTALPPASMMSRGRLGGRYGAVPPAASPAAAQQAAALPTLGISPR